MNNKVIIGSDSTSDLSSELREKYGIKIVPLSVELGGKNYTDGVDIDPENIYAHYEATGELPKTAAPSLTDFEEFFKENTKDGSAVVFFTISAEMSCTYNNARLAAEGFENVYVVNTKNLSTGGGLLVLEAAEMVRRGESAKTIAKKCEELIGFVDASFVIDNLKFLHKGGRCSAIAAFGANLLSLKPCITVKDGKMGVAKKYRGNFKKVLEEYITERVGDGSDIVQNHVFITHAGCDAEIYETCSKQLKSLMPSCNVHITRAGCTISSHCGRNTLGVLFIRKDAGNN